MLISLIVAMSRNRAIGNAGRIPWSLPRDLKRFREITWGKPIIMGRKTHETLRRPLPGRTNIILTHQKDYSASGCHVAHSVAEALEIAQVDNASEIMIIGGSRVFLDFLPLSQRVYLTQVNAIFDGDAFLDVNFLELPEWETIKREVWPADSRNPVDATFFILERKQSTSSVKTPDNLLVL